MIFKGYKTGIFQDIYNMVEAHNGYFDYTDNDQNMFFTFPSGDEKNDCFEAILSLGMNITVDKTDGLHLQVAII